MKAGTSLRGGAGFWEYFRRGHHGSGSNCQFPAWGKNRCYVAELADRCVALGSGMLVDPFAGTGSTVLAAIRAGRDWLACGSNPSYLEAFEMRRSMMA